MCIKEDIQQVDFSYLDKIYSDGFHSVKAKKEFYMPYASVLKKWMERVDPFSVEYKNRVEWLYEKIHEKTYSYENEGMSEMGEASREKYILEGAPYSSGVRETTLRKLKTSIDILEILSRIPHIKRILEPGFGFGGTTEVLVRSRYDVTAVDASELQCRLVSERLSGFMDRLHIVCNNIMDYLENTKIGEAHDAVVFCAIFHHLIDHAKILKTLIQKSLSPSGCILLIDEPIYPDEISREFLPYPWGFRFDHESMYRVRKQGWIELGFRESYIRNLCEHIGIRFISFRMSGPTNTYLLTNDRNTLERFRAYTAYGIDATNLYRYILGRMPESKAVISSTAHELEKFGFSHVWERFIRSPEFRKKYEKIFG